MCFDLTGETFIQNFNILNIFQPASIVQLMSVLLQRFCPKPILNVVSLSLLSMVTNRYESAPDERG